MTLSEWLDIWLTEYKENTLRPSTMRSYRQHIDAYIKPQLGQKQISLITSQDIQRMYNRLKRAGAFTSPLKRGSFSLTPLSTTFTPCFMVL